MTPGKRLKALAIVLLCPLATGLSGCGGESTPLPYGYYRIDLPEATYSHFDATGYPYSFLLSDQAVVEPDQEPDAERYWINIRYPAYNATINVSYKNVRSDTALIGYKKDCHRLAYAHTVKAESIKEQAFERKGKIHGLLYLIEGNTASSTQFFVTDSTRHFLRGSLYFRAHPNKDSLAPVIDYLRKDIITLMNSVNFSR